MAKILIVDDEVTIIELLEDCLNEAGHQVTAAHDITEAIRALNAERFDLAIIDARMRGRVEGLDVCRLIKGNPRTARTRVLIVSGLPEMETLAFLEGADAFMAKPFPLEDLRARLSALADGAAPRALVAPNRARHL